MKIEPHVNDKGVARVRESVQFRHVAVNDDGQYCIVLARPDDDDDLTCLAGGTMLVLRLQPLVTAEEADDLAYRLNLFGYAWEAVCHPSGPPDKPTYPSVGPFKQAA